MRPFLLLAFAASLGAQPVDRTKPPKTPDVGAWKLPPLVESTLPNGLTVVLMQDDRLPLVTIRLTFPGGSRRDPKNLPGLASAVADMMMQGTANRNFSQIAEAVDRMGASMNVSANADRISLSGAVISENLAPMLDTVGDVARNSVFPEVELTLLRQNRAQSLARLRAQPAYLANEVFRMAIFGDHPYGRGEANPASIGQISQQVLLAYRNAFILPNNAFLILAGRLPPRAELMKLISDRFSTWPRKPVPEITDPPIPPPKRRLILVDRPGSPQAQIRMGKVGPTYKDAGFFALMVANNVLTGAPVGRMSREIREKLGADVRGEPAILDEGGSMSFIAQMKTESAGEVLDAMIGHLDRIAKDPVPDEELAAAKESAIGTFLLRVQNLANTAEDISILKVLNLPASFIEDFTARVNAVQAEDVRQASAKYLLPDEDAIVVVGDAAKLQPQLQKFGTFEVLKTR